MQTVSKNWKDIHKRTLLNESFVEVSLNIADPESIAVAESQDNGSAYISDSSELTNGVDKTPTPYCTLEQNLWCLDGNRKAIPESNFGDSSYVGDVLSDENCIFSGKLPIITIEFKRVFYKLIPGVTITWSPTYNEFADTFVVIAYNGDTIVAEKEVVGNKSVKSLILTDIIGYDRITIVIKKWCLPYHRARVEEIFVGLNKVYGKTDLFDYSHSQSVDPVSTSLPKSEIKFSINNVEGEYNPHNTNGLAKYLMERQEVKSRYGLKMDDGSIEWIDGGTFYLSAWYAKQNGMTADFTARDLLELMSDNYDDTSYYEVVESASLRTDGEGYKVDGNGTRILDKDGNIVYTRSFFDLATLVLNTADLPLNSDGIVKWIIDESLKSKYTTAPLPNDTRANCLQLIANAAECVLYQDRKGILHIEPLKEYMEIEDADYQINSFNSYSKSEITLSKPVNRVSVKLWSYRLGENGVESQSSMPSMFISAPGGERITVDNPLVTDIDMVDGVATFIGSYLKNRMILDSSWRADVRVDPLDIVTNKNDFGSHGVRMTEVEFKYNGTFRGTGKGRVI